MTNQTSEMFEFPKMMYIYFVTSVVCVLWIIDVAFNPRRIILSLPLITAFIFFMSQCIATVFSVDIHTSIFGYYGRFNGGLLSTFSYITLFFIAVQVFDKKAFIKLLYTSLVSSTAVLLWGLPGRVFGVDLSCILFRGDFSTSCWTNEFRPQERMFSTLGQPNWLGSYFAVHFFIALFLLMQKDILRCIKEKGYSKVIWFVELWYMFLMVWGVYTTGSRSSQIGLFVGLMVIAFFYARRKVSQKTIYVFSALLCLGVLGTSGWYLTQLNNKRSNDITHSGTIRLIVWEGALRLAARYPLIGTGPETFAYTYYLTRPLAHNDTTERDFIYNKAHNELLHILATSGFIGMSAYLCMLMVWGRRLFSQSDTIALGAGLGALCAINFFGFSTSTSQLLLYMLPVYALIQAKQETELYSYSKRVWLSWGATLFSLLVWIFSLTYIRNYIYADMAYARAMQYQYEGSMDALEEFHKAMGYRFEHVYASKFALTAAQTAYAISHIEQKEDVYKDQIQTLTDIAVGMQNNALRSSPQNPMYWKERVRMYSIILQLAADADKETYTDQIEFALRKVALLAPTDPEIQELQKLSKE